MTVDDSARRIVFVAAFLVPPTPLATARAQTPAAGVDWAPCASLLPEMAKPIALPLESECASLLPGQARDAIDHDLPTGETPPPNTVYAS